MNPKRKKQLKWLVANLCRLLLSVTFVFSGVVKLIDPRGTQYKIEDYAVAMGAYEWLPADVPLAIAFVLAMFEFYLGFNLFFGIRRRTTTRLALCLMLLMTPVTLWLALTNAVGDCGCFGDALRLTNWQTFGKNALLLVAAVVAMCYYRLLTRFITERNQWLLSLYAMVFALFLGLYNIRHLPVIDFRPFRIGTDLPKAMMAEWEGETEEFQYADFVLQTLQGEDITMDWLAQPGYKFLLVSPFLEQADDGTMDRINALYDYCQQQGYPFLAVTSSLQESIDRWKDLTGAEYDFVLCDGTMLKTVIRSNPGLLMLHDGVIYQKWASANLPDVALDSEPLERSDLGRMQLRTRLQAINRLILWFVLPLLLWTLVDRIWVGRKFYKRRKESEKRKDKSEIKDNKDIN